MYIINLIDLYTQYIKYQKRFQAILKYLSNKTVSFLLLIAKFHSKGIQIQR